MKIAQLRYDDRSRIWTLYCIDRNERWWPYDFAEPSPDVGEPARRAGRGSVRDLLGVTTGARNGRVTSSEIVLRKFRNGEPEIPNGL